VIEFLMSFSPEQQAMLAGVVITIVVYIGRLIVPVFFADESSIAKLRRMLNVATLTAFVALAACAVSESGVCFGCWIYQFVIIFLTSQTSHSVVSTVTKAVRSE